MNGPIFMFGGTIPWSFPTSINAKPVPRWPDRRSYRAHQRDAAKRRNIAKGGRR